MPRFQDDGKYLSEFMSCVRVKCPFCGQDGVVTVADHSASGNSRATRSFSCSHCASSFSQADDRWFGPFSGHARRRCRRCGRWLEKQLPHREVRRDTVELDCPGCGATSLSEVNWLRVIASTRDPWFGLPLWLHTPCCGHALWALNENHLELLRAYVSATIRERVPNRNASLVSRLPDWLKAAKNRDAVLRSVAKLERLVVWESTPTTNDT